MPHTIARNGDHCMGVDDHGFECCPHVWSGQILSTVDSVLAEQAHVACLGDRVITTCPHCGTGRINSASNSVFVVGKPVARLGDEVLTPAGRGNIVGAAIKVYAK